MRPPRKRTSPPVGRWTPARIEISVDFAGAVLAEEDVHLARSEREVDAVEGEDAGILLADPDGFEKGSGSGGRSRPQVLCPLRSFRASRRR